MKNISTRNFDYTTMSQQNGRGLYFRFFLLVNKRVAAVDRNYEREVELELSDEY